MPFVDELAARLVAQSVGVLGSNIFTGSGATIPPPPAEGPYLLIVETGGSAPTRVHNQAAAHTQRPTAQISVRGASMLTVRAMSKAAYLALDGIFNTTLSGTFYQKLTARQEPTDLGPEEGTARRFVVFNVEAEKQPS